MKFYNYRKDLIALHYFLHKNVVVNINYKKKPSAKNGRLNFLIKKNYKYNRY
jgi:hypothetical protein